MVFLHPCYFFFPSFFVVSFCPLFFVARELCSYSHFNPVPLIFFPPPTLLSPPLTSAFYFPPSIFHFLFYVGRTPPLPVLMCVFFLWGVFVPGLCNPLPLTLTVFFPLFFSCHLFCRFTTIQPFFYLPYPPFACVLFDTLCPLIGRFPTLTPPFDPIF